MFWDKAPVRDLANRLGVGKGIVQRPKVGTPSGQIEFDNLIHVFKAFGCKHSAPLYNLNSSDIFRYIESIKNEALTYRLVWNFLSMEIFLRLFVEHEPPTAIEDEINGIITKY